MTATLEAPVNVEVWDPSGQHSITLGGISPQTPVSEVVGLTKVQMVLPPSVPWLLRDNPTARLLRADQTVGEVAREGRAELSMQPDAILG